MQLTNFYQQQENTLRFDREQASLFAKQIAGDFNPIHDVDARRFCVPGDLLFAIMLERHGLYRHMDIEFAGMVTEQSQVITEISANRIRLHSDKDTDFLVVQHDEQRCGDEKFIAELTNAYVTFSGQTFPHILVPVMKQHDIMINPSRPIVMYRKMSLSLHHCSGTNISLAYKGAEFTSSGKKGEVSLHFDIKSGDQTIGTGMKNMLLSGLRPYDQESIDQITTEYDTWKSKAVSQD